MKDDTVVGVIGILTWVALFLVAAWLDAQDLHRALPTP